MVLAVRMSDHSPAPASFICPDVEVVTDMLELSSELELVA